MRLAWQRICRPRQRGGTGVHDGRCVVLCIQVSVSFMHCFACDLSACSVFGIEKMAHPADYAVKLLSRLANSIAVANIDIAELLLRFKFVFNFFYL